MAYSQNDIIVIKVDLDRRMIGYKNIVKHKEFHHEIINKEVFNIENQYFYVESMYKNDSVSLLPMSKEYYFWLIKYLKKDYVVKLFFFLMQFFL